MVSCPETVLRESFGRREFLRRGGGGLLLALGGVLPGCRGNSQEPDGGQAFSDSQRLTLRAICERMLPGGRRAPSAASIDVAGRIEVLVAELGPGALSDFTRLLTLFEWSPFVFEAIPGRFSTLAPDRQTEVIHGWAQSRLEFRRTGFVAVKRLAMSVYYAQEESWRAIGFPGPWLQS